MFLFYWVPISVLKGAIKLKRESSPPDYFIAFAGGVLTYFIFTIITSEFLFENGAVQFAVFTAIASAMFYGKFRSEEMASNAEREGPGLLAGT